jgi:hypothetical protein
MIARMTIPTNAITMVTTGMIFAITRIMTAVMRITITHGKRKVTVARHIGIAIPPKNIYPRARDSRMANDSGSSGWDTTSSIA